MILLSGITQTVVMFPRIMEDHSFVTKKGSPIETKAVFMIEEGNPELNLFLSPNHLFRHHFIAFLRS